MPEKPVTVPPEELITSTLPTTAVPEATETITFVAVTTTETAESHVTTPASAESSTSSVSKPSVIVLEHGTQKGMNLMTLILFRLLAGCIVTFQAEALDKRPKEFTSGFELFSKADTPEKCAATCYQVRAGSPEPTLHD